MKFEPLECPECGEPAVGTVESLLGTAEFDEPDEDGNVEYSGNTDVSWDSQETVTNEAGQVQLICDNGDVWFAKMEETT